ncbi:MAG: hypothetical protein VX836_18375 [Pseudomonadota bacterium]|nr:hypothetical protein [Pseudomonadota bacterium]
MTEDHLIPWREWLRSIGVKSDATGRAMVKRREIPQPIQRNGRNYMLASEREKYMQRLTASRSHRVSAERARA